MTSTATRALFAPPRAVPRSRGTVVSAVSSVSKGTTTPADSESAWTQRVITLEPKSRGIFIWTDTLRTSLPEMRDVRVGMVSLFLRSTTGALTVNENCDPDVRTDMQNALEAIIPRDPRDADEARAALVGCSLDLPVHDGRLALGTWQGLYVLASRAGPVEVVATLVATGQDCAKNVKLPAPSRGCHPARDALAAPAGGGAAGSGDGVFLTNVLVKHTSASVTVNDATDPRVCSALESALSSLVPESWNYPGGAVTFRHTDEGDDDMPAHVKSTLVGASATFPVAPTGLAAFGATQGVLLCEHRSGGGFGGSGATRDAVVTRVRSKRGYRVVLAVDVTEACVDVTEALRDAVSRASLKRGADAFVEKKRNENADPEWKKKISAGVAHAFVRHTSASLVVGSARDGFGVSFVRALDDALPFASNENAKTTLTSVSATLPVSGGALALGANQAVFLCEHARSGVGGSREIVVTVCGD